ncbi:MAG: GTP cyclohydrolase I FolE [Eggerthellales bacterium]|nr:GTP cyclohydrolase I FolE [Eggerthellales bacterium]
MVDQKKAETAVRMLLEAIGEDPDREGLRETPQRVARMYQEICGGYDQDAKDHLSTVFEDRNSTMVVERDIPFYSLCEHHMLPFMGRVHIGYIPNGQVTGLSKLARTVEVFARRLQIQERMTGQIADAIMESMNAAGAIVVVEAEHLCMSMRGVRKPGATTTTVVKRGEFVTNPAAEDEFFRLLRL